MHLETDRLVIRNFLPGDGEALHGILGDRETMAFVEPPYSREKTEEFLRTFCLKEDPPRAYGAALKEGGTLIGYLLFQPMDTPGLYEMGWIFHRAYWRQGYALEGCRALIDHGFTQMNIHKICAETIDPVASLPLMERLGMTLEGVQRQHRLRPGGGWADLYWAGILQKEWQRPWKS